METEPRAALPLLLFHLAPTRWHCWGQPDSTEKTPRASCGVDSNDGGGSLRKDQPSLKNPILWPWSFQFLAFVLSAKTPSHFSRNKQAHLHCDLCLILQAQTFLDPPLLLTFGCMAAFPCELSKYGVSFSPFLRSFAFLSTVSTSFLFHVFCVVSFSYCTIMVL